MTRSQLERELAQATGETKATIRARGFSVVIQPELEPLTVDWEGLDAQRVGLFPNRQDRGSTA